MALMAGHFMVDHLLGPVIMKLIEACHLYLKDQVRWQTGMKEELQSLQENLPHIQAVVSFYSQLEIKDSALNKWYWQLRDAIDEADDVLDEFDYWKLQKSIPKIVYKFFERAFKTDPMLKKLEAVVHKLHRISAQVSTFLHLLDHANQEQQQQQLELHRMREAGAIPGTELIGRSKEMEYVRHWLRKSDQTETSGTGLYGNISLLSVVGHGGMGKTTLLQNVFQDGATDEFSVKMFVCVNKNFDAKTLIKNMLESHKKEKTELDTLGALQSSLRSEVTSKRFLLVLDDVWEEDDDGKWENLLAPLQYGSSGSKILITTRLDSVATKFANLIKKRKEILPIAGLEEEVCLQLFNAHAFAGVENPDDEFRYIARKMVEKLLGCPLAIKVIGGILNLYRDKSYWIKVLNTNIGKVAYDQNHLLPILKLSYSYLPKILQNCFSFCGIFPQDHMFDEDDLVRMWIALGIIESSNIQEDMDTGRRYFNILVQKSFFEEYCSVFGEACYKMHDLLHELAQFVSAQECFRIVDDRLFSIPKTTRHLSFNGTSRSLEAAFKKMGNFKILRSLFLTISDADHEEFDKNVVCKILKASKSIRLLAIDYTNPEKPLEPYEMPDTIDCLIHLRYLKAQNFWNLEFPRSISHLYHLQFVSLKNLSVDNIDWKDLLPNEICQLIIDILFISDPCATQLIMEPLRRFMSFRCIIFWNNDELVSFPIEWFLQQSSSLNLLVFQNLQSLQSLPSLESLPSLVYLIVHDVPQLKLFPNLLASLKNLYLYNLKSLQCLPPSLSTLTSLKSLKLSDIPLLKSLPDLPSSLKKLRLKELESLQCLPSSLSVISSLETLKLINIPLLKSLPDLPSSLKYLKLKELGSLLYLPSSLSTISFLHTLKLINIALLKSSFIEFPKLPASLQELYIKDCDPRLMKRYPNFDRRR